MYCVFFFGNRYKHFTCNVKVIPWGLLHFLPSCFDVWFSWLHWPPLPFDGIWWTHAANVVTTDWCGFFSCGFVRHATPLHEIVSAHNKHLLPVHDGVFHVVHMTLSWPSRVSQWHGWMEQSVWWVVVILILKNTTTTSMRVHVVSCIWGLVEDRAAKTSTWKVLLTWAKTRSPRRRSSSHRHRCIITLYVKSLLILCRGLSRVKHCLATEWTSARNSTYVYPYINCFSMYVYMYDYDVCMLGS